MAAHVAHQALTDDLPVLSLPTEATDHVTSGLATQYTAEVYNNLKDIGDASDELVKVGGLALIHGVLSNLAQSYGVVADFGVQILHKHFRLTNDEMMVSFGCVSLPISLADMKEESLSSVYPTAWLFMEDGFYMPYEFRAHDDVHKQSALQLQFMSEFGRLLKQYNLCHLLALVDMRSTTLGLEQTYDKANITLPAEFLSRSDGYLDVLWTFGERESKGQCKKKCEMKGAQGHVDRHIFS